MASHSGLKYVLETKYGYVKEDGTFTDDKSEALLIDFWQFGFGPEAKEVYKSLGFNNLDVLESGVSFCTVIPSYEARSSAGLGYYELMGYDLRESLEKSRNDYYCYNLHNDNNYLEYKDKLKMKKKDYYYTHGTKCFDLEGITLYQIDSERQDVEGGELGEYYSDLGYVYKYTIPLKNPHVEKYFDFNNEKRDYYNHFQQVGLIDYFKNHFNEEKFSWGLNYNTKLLDIKIMDDQLVMYFDDWNNYNGFKVAKCLNNVIREYYSNREMHITRMFGSYILLVREGENLVAKEVTNIPIKYCPLMIKLLKEVGGDTANFLLHTLETEDLATQQEAMCNLINEVVIKGGYFDTNRPLNSCEANVLFGASETMASAFMMDIIDAAVIVSNNLGTIITTSAPTTQGAVKRMTGLFYTSPDKKIMDTAKKEKIVPVFPYSAEIDQLAGVKKAIELGYKRIAVSVAADNNYLHEELKRLEKLHDVKIYKFGLCSTGIKEHTAEIMKEYADVVWSCASKNVLEYIEPNAIMQVGLKIPVHIMTSEGWEIVSNHLKVMDASLDVSNIELTNGEEKSIIVNGDKGLKVLKKKQIKGCVDCPHPCI